MDMKYTAIQKACELWGIDVIDYSGLLQDKNKGKLCSEMTKAVAYYLYTVAGWNYAKIGEELHRDRTTIMKAIENCEIFMYVDDEFREKVEALIRS